MLEFLKYAAEYKVKWDELISSSRNGNFLFYQDYMDYHSDRYKDLSFMIYRKGKIEAVIPGNFNNSTYFSLQGLTYGGLATSSKICTTDVLEIFDLINKELREIGATEVIYKPIPLIYHSIPGQEDIYALFKNKAKKIGCNISSTIYRTNQIKFIESRKSGIRKSIREGVIIKESNDFDCFWEILNDNLAKKYNIEPAHTLQEMLLLKSRFPENIKLYIAQKEDTIIAGTVLYCTKNVIHVQYISANELGKTVGALDLLFNDLINNQFPSVSIFDFGQSTEKMGNYLNENLIFQKEGFGGRGVVYDIYSYKLK